VNRIWQKKTLAPGVKLIDLEAPHVARKTCPGQFVVVRTHEQGERIPLTIADVNRDQGLVTLIFQEVGKSTRHLGMLEPGDELADVVGPLGCPTHVERVGTVVPVGGGIGIAPVYPIARAFRDAGNRVVSIIGARSRELLILEEEMRAVSNEVHITTDDGSYGRRGFVVDQLKDLLDQPGTVDLVVAIGPAIMMKMVSLLTQPYGVRTVVSLNSIMVDGTGMCGACRVEVGGKTRFVCVDGPDFDGHQVNFDQLIARQRIYLPEEARSVQLFEERPRPDAGDGKDGVLHG
jgi:ferredoxin--NADP+ reductase